jgi:hypothetical protein
VLTRAFVSRSISFFSLRASDSSSGARARDYGAAVVLVRVPNRDAAWSPTSGAIRMTTA